MLVPILHSPLTSPVLGISLQSLIAILSKQANAWIANGGQPSIPIQELRFDVSSQSIDCQFRQNSNPEIAKVHQTLPEGKRKDEVLYMYHSAHSNPRIAGRSPLNQLLPNVL